jgi:2-oxoglutarate ferredoxin oxidoreductase subunit gamma
MMADNRINIQFCGFGGQGIILLAVLFGTTAVTKAGMNAVQTQSYGSEARGGECQAEVIVSNETIGSPLADQMDILVSMSQSALDKYLPRLRPGGTLIYDPELVERPDRIDIMAVEVPATQTAGEIGVKLAANMAMLGFLRQATGLFTEDDMFEVIRENVPQRFKDANIEAAKRGGSLARERRVALEV